ncbi:MAG: hypothetical protein Q9215_001167 [Flavoplaca cf. flavocitrina]
MTIAEELRSRNFKRTPVLKGRLGSEYYASSSASLSESPTYSITPSSSSSASSACALSTHDKVSGLVLIFVEVPLLLRICPTSEKFDVFIRRFTTNYMRAGMYGVMSLVQWLTLVTNRTTSLLAAAVFLLLAAVCYLIAGLKGQGFVGSKTLGGQGVAQMIV